MITYDFVMLHVYMYKYVIVELLVIFWYDHGSTWNQVCDFPVGLNQIANREHDLPVVLNHVLDLQSNGKSLLDFTTNKSFIDSRNHE